MRQYDTSNLIIHAGNATDPNAVVEVTPELAGWDYIHFQVCYLLPRQTTLSVTPSRIPILGMPRIRAEVERKNSKNPH